VYTVDVGNSSITVGHWIGADVVVRRFGEPAAAAEAIAGPAFLISVSADRLKLLLRAMDEQLAQQATVLAGIPVALMDDALAVSTGQDRLAAALAVSPGPAIVVDAGTALTVDLVDEHGTFLGGFIAPGPQAALDGLAKAGAALPSLQQEVWEMTPGVDTASAMGAGVWGMVVGGTDRLVQTALARLPGARLVVTGGWGAAWMKQSALCAQEGGTDRDIVHDETLVHRGIARWAQVERQLPS
jgi:pantothenate kinase type III